MANEHRDIQDLVMDYAGALRDGCISDFLKSLTRTEAATLHASRELSEAVEMVRLLNVTSFGDKAVAPNVGLFTARVDARIGARLKHANLESPVQRTLPARRTEQ